MLAAEISDRYYEVLLEYRYVIGLIGAGRNENILHEALALIPVSLALLSFSRYRGRFGEARIIN